MLYHVYEFRRTAIELQLQALQLQTRALRALPAPVADSLPVRVSLAAADVYSALEVTHTRPEFGVRTARSGGAEVEVREEVVASTPFASLVRFTKADGSSDRQQKVLIVPGLAGHFATLVRGTVATMLEDHDVYVADWHSARDVPASAGRFGLDEFIAHLIDFLKEIGPGAHLMAICQPAVACVVAAAILEEDGDPARPASLILMAGPVDAEVNPGKLGRFSDQPPMSLLQRVVLHSVPGPYDGRGRRVYPGFLQLAGFVSMDPRRHISRFGSLFADLVRGDAEAVRKTTDFYREYFAVIDIAGEFYVETVQRVFRGNDLARGRFTWRGRRVDPSKITSALFTIEGALDEMCTPGQTEAAHDLCTGIPAERHRHLLQEGVGHYGVFAGSTFDRQIYPAIREFIAQASLAENTAGAK